MGTDFKEDIVRSKPPDFSLQVYSSRSRPRQLQLPWCTSEEKPEIRELRSPVGASGILKQSEKVTLILFSLLEHILFSLAGSESCCMSHFSDELSHE